MIICTANYRKGLEIRARYPISRASAPSNYSNQTILSLLTLSHQFVAWEANKGSYSYFPHSAGLLTDPGAQDAPGPLPVRSVHLPTCLVCGPHHAWVTIQLHAKQQAAPGRAPTGPPPPREQRQHTEGWQGPPKS